MASEDDSSKGFKIQDRRRFSAEGELKPEFSGAEEPAPEKPGEPLAGGRPPQSAGAHAPAQQQPRQEDEIVVSQPRQAAAAEGYAAARSTAGAEAHPSEVGAEMGAETAEISFSAFLMSLSTEALVHLEGFAGLG